LTEHTGQLRMRRPETSFPFRKTPFRSLETRKTGWRLWRVSGRARQRGAVCVYLGLVCGLPAALLCTDFDATAKDFVALPPKRPCRCTNRHRRYSEVRTKRAETADKRRARVCDHTIPSAYSPWRRCSLLAPAP